MSDSKLVKKVHEEIAAWYAELGDCVDKVDYGRAKNLYRPDVVNFSTVSTMLRGVEELREKQWRRVWPTIENYRHKTETLISEVSDDGTMAWGMLVWESKGIHQDGSRFDRPGRATTTFVRDPKTGKLLGTHIHFSLFPGTPDRSFGKKPEKF